MSQLHCAVCDSLLGEALYRSQSDRSLSSLCRIHNTATTVFACRHCGHLQTQAIADIDIYYDANYDILVDSEEEDQIYEVRNGDLIYRTDHQVKTLLDELGFENHVDLLDYGCAKSSTIRRLCSISSNVTPHLFDVSARYIPFWEKFVRQNNWAVNTIPSEWTSRFDVVTSFFSLEHIPMVTETMRNIFDLLKPDGLFYGVVPNVFSNIADYVVIDHCNHFTLTSLKRLLNDAGLEVQKIDSQAHRGALVFIARRPRNEAPVTSSAPRVEIEQIHTNLLLLADFWRNAAARIRVHEASLVGKEEIAIYGAGFYGAFISASLAHPKRVICHLDQNPHLQGKKFNECPILTPRELPAEVKTIFVGLNPAHAKGIISNIPSLARRKLDYFFL